MNSIAENESITERQTRSIGGKPLGYIQLETGLKAVTAMNDIFLNYQFEKKENWENLRSIINIFLGSYMEKFPGTVARLITGDIEVETQFKILLDPSAKQKSQDIKVSGQDVVYVEFQSKTHSDPPIEIRSQEYLGLGIGHGRGRKANQIWLLGEDAERIFHGSRYSAYVLKDEATNINFPGTSYMMFVCLPRVAGEESPAGELASFLLGRADTAEEITDPEARRVAEGFLTSFRVFCEDKEARHVMTVEERFTRKGIAEGIAEGEARGIEAKAIETAFEMFKDGFDYERIAKYVKMPVTWVEETLRERTPSSL